MTQTTGFVLAGGGFKGAFELGALAHLVKARGITPDVIASASAGSILGMVLAQGRDRDEFAERLEDARRTLLAMTHTDLVFGEQEWLSEFHGSPFAEGVKAMITERTTPEVPGGDPDPDAPPALDKPKRRRRSWPEVTKLSEQLKSASRARKTLTGTTSSVLTLDPFERAIRGEVDVGIPAIDTTKIDRPGLLLRMAVTAVKQRQTHYVCQDGTIVGEDAVTPLRDGAPPVGIIDGAIASSSVPMVFPARRLGDDTYVDGGCLQNIPLSAAVALGAQDIYTVVAVPLRDHDDDSAESRGPMWAAKELGFLQTQEANLAIPLPEGTTNTVIAPTLAVVGSFEVHRGLMQIDIDYGRMRAEETLTAPDDGLRPILVTASDTITVQRTRAWHLEQTCILAGTMSPTRFAALCEIKRAVRSAVRAREGLGFPAAAGSATWWTGYEVHSMDVPEGFPDTFLDD